MRDWVNPRQHKYVKKIEMKLNPKLFQSVVVAKDMDMISMMAGISSLQQSKMKMSNIKQRNNLPVKTNPLFDSLSKRL